MIRIMRLDRELIMDVSLNIIWFALFYGLLLFPAVMFTSMHWGELLAIMAAFLAYFMFIRRGVKPVVPMLIAHAIVPFAAWIMAPVHLQVIYTVIAVVLIIVSLIQRAQASSSVAGQFPGVASVVLVILGMVAVLYQLDLVAHYIIAVIITGIGGRLHRRTYLADLSIQDINQLSTQPMNKIMTADNKVILSTGALMTVATVALGMLVLRPILQLVGRLISIGGRDIPMPYGMPDVELVEWESPLAGNQDVIMATGEFAESGLLWWLYNQLVLLTVLIVSLITLIALAKAYADYFLRMKENKPTPDTDDIDGEEKEFLESPKLRGLWRRKPYNEHILRKQFRETVVRHKRKGIPIIQSDTPIEMSVKIVAEDISELAEAYASVRYKA